MACAAARAAFVVLLAAAAGAQLVIPPANAPSQDTTTTTTTTTSLAVCAGTQTYTVTMNGRWSSFFTVRDFPSGQDHWSPLVVASHANGFRLAQAGAFASLGEEVIAESGATSQLAAELEDNALVRSYDVHEGPTGSGTGTQEVLVTVSPQFPYLSGMSMMAPSPDWFTAFRINMCDESTGQWKASAQKLAKLYDAGTDRGKTFKASDRPLSGADAVPISAITEATGNEKYPFFQPGVPISTLAAFVFKASSSAGSPVTRRRRRRRRTRSTTAEPSQRRRTRTRRSDRSFFRFRRAVDGARRTRRRDAGTEERRRRRRDAGAEERRRRTTRRRRRTSDS